MNHIIIKSATVEQRQIKRKDGTLVTFREQKGAIEKGEDFPTPFRFNLGDQQPPYPPGNYLLDVSSLEVGDFDSLRVGRRLALIPMPQPKA
ncbi:G5P family DNA-binding protein [Pseudoxanthomonas winnipegensis]|uniref:single-stranded DNA-binding protein n=1 Tax=Pseudoxanthomonas winnipegensis TaxID=2480810 RepID=UPI00257585C3|nr:single-stranded DNA-binding protein [Pseudoxanthomonas winnipegensis]WJI17477.1 G5P family DNA-binding protein [Pseudoxanthomonas winnipegensis]